MTLLTPPRHTPLIWAHRGGRSLAPENTLRALRLGRRAGAHGCEIDVQLTRDAQVIVLHDLNLLRTTDAGAHPLFASGPPPLPWLHTLADIRALCARAGPPGDGERTVEQDGERHVPPGGHAPGMHRPGSGPAGALRPGVDPPGGCPPGRHLPGEDACGACPADLRVPTLAEALRLTRELGMRLNVEIKDLSRAAPPELAGSVVERVLGVVAGEGMEARVLVSSFSVEAVRRSKELAPGVPAALLTPHGFRGDLPRALEAARADAWHPGHRGLEERAVRAALDAGYAVTPYTVNDARDMLRLADWGVTGIVTDRPQDAPWGRREEGAA